MKKMRKLMALVIAMVMIVSTMSMTAFAAPAPVDAGSYDPTLTVSGTAAGDTLSFYKVIEWVGEAQGNVGGWAARAPYAGVLTDTVLAQVLGVGQTATGITSDIAGQLASAAASDTAVQSGTNTALDVTASDDLGPGTYLVLINPADPEMVYNPVIVSSDFTMDNPEVDVKKDAYADAVAKYSKPELDKTAATSEDAWDDNKWTTTAIGDEVTFTVKTTIPGYGELYQNPYFAVHDKLTDLTLNLDSVTVADPTSLTKGTEYTVVQEGNGFKLEFATDFLKTVKTPTAVEITYTAIVSTTAPVHVNTEKNEVSTVFSHIPTSENDYAFKKDTTEHYTFALDASGLGGYSDQFGRWTSELVKIGTNPDGTPITSEKIYSKVDPRNYYEGPLEGAEFKLYTDPNCNNEYIPKNPDGSAGTAPLTLKSGADGRFEIKGLDAGTYYLLETKAPAGYIRDTNPHTIIINAETESVDVTEYTLDGVDWISEEDYNALADKTGYKSYKFATDVLKSYDITIDNKPTAHYEFTNKGTDAEIVWTEDPVSPSEDPFEIDNPKGVELPSTGGIGTTLFYIVGAVLVVGAGIVLVTRRRMSAR